MEAIALKQAIQFHYAIGIVLAAIFIINIAILFMKDFYKVHKYMWYSTPIIFGILAITIISGFSILAMNKFNTNIKVLFMIVVNVAIIIFEIIRIKKLRIVRKKPSLIKQYKTQSKILYIGYLFAISIFFY